MTQPRRQQVSVTDTPFYNITSRCVRRAFLCGVDQYSGRSYEHRRAWVEQRIRILSSIFAIDVCAYAVMSNHLHLVVQLKPQEAENWTADEVLVRWCSLFKGAPLVQKYLEGEELQSAERDTVSDCIIQYQKRLQSLSWFMKCLNEPIARQANKEDKCTGHFWEGRFKSQALLTDEALLSAMAYVDLNPIRAGMATTPESSDYTSIKERITPSFELSQAVRQQAQLECLKSFSLPLKPLATFEGALKFERQEGIHFHLADYIELVDATGRIIRNDKRCAIPSNLPPILERLKISLDAWLEQSQHFERDYLERFSGRRPRKKKAA